MRIVSLLPSTTEIVCALGLEDALVGITHECDYPQSVTGKPRLTSSRISQETVEILARVLHPEVFGPPDDSQAVRVPAALMKS